MFSEAQVRGAGGGLFLDSSYIAVSSFLGLSVGVLFGMDFLWGFVLVCFCV